MQQLTGLADIATGNTQSGKDALYRSTVGRIYRDQGGQQRRDVGDVYAGGLDAARQRAYDALKQTPEWRAAKDDKERASLTRRTDNEVERQYQQQPDVTVPDWAQPERRDGPPKYDRSKPWVQKIMQETGAADAYELEQAINAAVATPAKSRTAIQRRLAYYAQYVTPEYRKWAREHAAEQGRTRETVRGLATAGVGGG
jgi:AcrR family transcriptional regulator